MFQKKSSNATQETNVNRISQLSISDDPFERYRFFGAMYDSNNLYTEIKRTADQNGDYFENIFSIANATHRSVEFYANRLMLNARITTKNQLLLDALNQFWMDTNFLGTKDNNSRELAKNGDLFIKLENDRTKVWMKKIEPRHVTTVEADSRGVVIEIRIDIPIEDNKTWTEFWTLDNGGYTAVWEHDQGINAELNTLGTPKYYATLSQYGITFIPIIWARFTSGDKRAENCFVHAISKMIEGDREHSRLAEIIYAFNNAIYTIESNAVADNGQFVGQPRVSFIKGDNGMVMQHVKNGTLKPNIPQLDYASHIKLIEITKEEIMQDLPETRLNSLDPTQATGCAIEQMLGESVSRAKTGRFNLVQEFRRLNMMALTIGQHFNIFDKSIGTYEEGNFQHEILCDSVIPLSKTDKSLMLQQFTSARMPLKAALRECEYSQAEIDQIMADKAEEEASLANQFLNNPAFSKDTNANQGG